MFGGNFEAFTGKIGQKRAVETIARLGSNLHSNVNKLPLNVSGGSWYIGTVHAERRKNKGKQPTKGNKQTQEPGQN